MTEWQQLGQDHWWLDGYPKTIVPARVEGKYRITGTELPLFDTLDQAKVAYLMLRACTTS